MYQIIGEKVAVLGIYDQGRFTPHKFKWRAQTFLISELCSRHNFKDGGVRKQRFSVKAKGTVFLLEFNQDIETWNLEQIWVED
jgi:hypothetical protein